MPLTLGEFRRRQEALSFFCHLLWPKSKCMARLEPRSHVEYACQRDRWRFLLVSGGARLRKRLPAWRVRGIGFSPRKLSNIWPGNGDIAEIPSKRKAKGILDIADENLRKLNRFA